MTDELLNALDDCLSAIMAGESLETSLARHPALADDLRPLLETALAAHHLSANVAVPRAAQNASRAQFLASAATLRSPAPPAAPRRSIWAWLNLNPRWLVNAIGVLLACLLGTYGVAAAAAQSLPGDVLYGVKRAVEQTQLTFTVDPQVRAHLRAQFATRRMDEVRAVLAAGRLARLEFGGVLEELNGDRWIVAGLVVLVPAETSITGVPFPGLFVEVLGESQSNGAVRASSVRVTGLTFRGRVSAIGADMWRVGERSVLINAQTELDDEIGLGDEVEVSAREMADGQVLGLRIMRVEEPAPPTATATLTSEATPGDATPIHVTATPIASASPTATQIRTSTPTPTPTRTHLPTRISLPTGTPTDGGPLTPFPTPPPTQRPPVSPTPESPATPTHSPEPTQTPEPHETEFSGTVTAINGNQWTIADHSVTTTGETEFEGNPGLGSFVDVNAWQYWDGTLIARRIRVR